MSSKIAAEPHFNRKRSAAQQLSDLFLQKEKVTNRVLAPSRVMNAERGIRVIGIYAVLFSLSVLKELKCDLLEKCV